MGGKDTEFTSFVKPDKPAPQRHQGHKGFIFLLFFVSLGLKKFCHKNGVIDPWVYLNH
jgi:hypothetical protein